LIFYSALFGIYVRCTRVSHFAELKANIYILLLPVASLVFPYSVPPGFVPSIYLLSIPNQVFWIFLVSVSQEGPSRQWDHVNFTLLPCWKLLTLTLSLMPVPLIFWALAWMLPLLLLGCNNTAKAFPVGAQTGDRKVI
jgi:hypothetical protein